MATEKLQSSFSPGRKWKIGSDLLARTILVVAVVVMANYIGAQFAKKIYLSSQTRIHLSSKTLGILHSLTNHVAVTLYYDRHDDFYPDITAMLNAYRAVNPKISIRTVDYIRDPGAAENVKEKYKQFFPPRGDKNLIIFDCDGRVKVAPGEALVQYGATGITKEKKLKISPVAFNAEQMFTSILLTLESDQLFKAYFAQGNGEPSPDDSGQTGYMKFASILRANYVDVQPLKLLGLDEIPQDCNLLIIAGPQQPFTKSELQVIDRYLSEGGRMFALLDFASIEHPTGLENVLAKWGVDVVPDIVRDMKNTTSANGTDVVVQRFGKHPIVSPLMESELQMIYPRPVFPITQKNSSDAPTVTELAFSGPESTLVNNSAEPPRSYPLMAAVEQKNNAGAAGSRGTMRMVVTGDSTFLNNQVIEGGSGGANRDFLANAVNWLLDRPNLLKGIGPRPITEFRLVLTRAQQTEINWLLLGALPGFALLLGGLVWFARRK